MQRIDLNIRKTTTRGEKGLVVDDNPVVRQEVSGALLSLGFAVCGAADTGHEAIELAKQLEPDLIFLDFSMPLMNGLQAAPELRKIAPKTRIVLLTMYGSELPQSEVEVYGVDLVASKTDNLHSVVSKARGLLKR
jgi:DNA-binding NarL/FixJ family response regulator